MQTGAIIRPVKVLLLIFAGVLGVMLIAGGLWWLSSAARGFWRVLIAGVLGLGIAIFGIGLFRQFANPPPPESPAEVPAVLGLAYICEVCGLELSLVKLGKEKAPKHCGEDMTLVRRG